MTATAATLRRKPFLQRFTGLTARSKRQAGLFFPRETWALRTQFRTDALHFIYGIAEAELGGRLRSASVSMWSQPGEPDSDYLLLTIVADADRDEMVPIGDSMIAAVCKAAESWTEQQRQDYASRVYFELIPLRE